MHYSEWIVVKTNEAYLQYLSKALNISVPLAQVLVSRGLKDLDEIYSFLNPSIDLIDPFSISGVYESAKIINDAIHSGKKILINGDYDADGLTGTAILYDLLKKRGADVFYHIPHRIHDGYGLTHKSIEIAKKFGAKLIITVDCGIKDFEAVQYAKKEGIDVIITDHHEPLRINENVTLPEALAVINPKTDKNSAYAFLAGVGVAFILSMAIDRKKAMEYLDLVTLGTYADMVPLNTINRAIIKEGWSLIENPYRKSIKILKEIVGINSNNIKNFHLSYCLIPRINAPGRIDHAGDVVKFFTSEDIEELSTIGQWLNQVNSLRQKTEEKILGEIEKKLEEEFNDESVIVLWDDWHVGVVGTVANKLIERFSRPVFILSIDENKAKGSARAPQGFDLQELLLGCKDLLIRFGGHKQAAGLMLYKENLREFKERICRLADSLFTDTKNVLQLDAAVTLGEVNERVVDEIKLLEPFGEGNREPLFGAKELTVVNLRKVGNNHLKMFLRQNGNSISAIGFEMAEENILEGCLIDAAFTPSINEWEGMKNLQLQLKAIRRAQR
ncbi:single-stranded-DNA-specific exonuclease RecJ [Thermodesulfovibrio sp. 1176]|uniref:single-stranded-DNA-specific exonuclease RecJ n=1 Tax=Thermodesulfovibrio sp. 1176 TaxID=3043424 RepID=UPI00248292E0|nr:single-stranded-DNA-specific exonuclease RecJ [Thermodesulfovibrio sp. 1176]MDI1471111.1 single-stranded-DNA-specific exonuclease RecJ [Thermodesulfovibrio sp. 1176]